MDGVEITTLRGLIDWAMRYGAAWLAFKLTDRFVNNEQLYTTKQYIAWAVAGLLSLVAWGIGIAMTYIDMPSNGLEFWAGGWRAWLEGAALVVTTVIILNRAIYSQAKAVVQIARAEAKEAKAAATK